jgi:hypothetical protein
MTDTVHPARSAIQRLLRSEAPNGIAPHDCGAWASVVQALADAYTAGGTPAVRSTFSALACAHQAFAALIAADAPAFPPTPRSSTSSWRKLASGLARCH